MTFYEMRPRVAKEPWCVIWLSRLLASYNIYKIYANPISNKIFILPCTWPPTLAKMYIHIVVLRYSTEQTVL